MANTDDIRSERGQESRHAADEAARTLKEEGRRLAAGVKAKADSLATGQKQTATSYLNDFSDAVNSLTSTLDEQGHDSIAKYTRSAAEELRRMSSSIEAREYTDLARDVGAFAQRNPALFFGGAFAIGFGLARFLASSRSAVDDDHGEDRHQPHPLTTGAAAPQPTYNEEVTRHG